MTCATQQQNSIVCLDCVIGISPDLGYYILSWVFFFFSALFIFVSHFVTHFTVQWLRRLKFWFFFASSFKLILITLKFGWCYKFLLNSLQQLQFERITSGARLTEHFKQVFKVLGLILQVWLAFSLTNSVFVCINAFLLFKMR